MGAHAKAAESQGERELVVTREYDIPARFLYEAWTKPEHIQQWFGPVGWPVTMAEMDFRVGGRWRFAMTGPSGEQNQPFGGVYREIVPNRRLVFENSFEAPDSPKMVMSVTFEEKKNGKTLLTWRTTFDSRAVRDDYQSKGMVEGTNSGLDQLGEFATKLAER